MTTISINSDCIKMRGHAGYAPSGQDIVCAGLTALVQTLIRSIDSLTGDKLNYCISSARVDIDLRNLSERSRLLVDSFFINKILSVVIGGNPLPLGGGMSLVNS